MRELWLETMGSAGRGLSLNCCEIPRNQQEPVEKLMFTAGIIRNENIALSHTIWTEVWSVFSVQSGNWEQLTTGPELARGLHPATATPGFQALDAFRIFGQLIVLSLSACLLYDLFFLEG